MANISVIVRSYRSFSNLFRLFIANLTKEEELQEITEFEVTEEAPEDDYIKQYRVSLIVNNLVYGNNEIAIKILGEDGIPRETTKIISNPEPVPNVPTIIPLSVVYVPVNPQTNHHRDIQLAWTPVVGYNRTTIFLGNSGNPKKIADQSAATYPAIGNMNLTAGETYSWKVDLHNDSLNQIIEGSIQWFRIAQSPGFPYASVPVDRAVDVNPSGIVLTWKVPNPEGNTLTFDVYFGANVSPSLVASSISPLTYSLPLLLNSKTYYWKIVVKDNKGNVVIGPQWKFKTQA